MKKLVLLLMLISTPVHAATISIATFSADTTVAAMDSAFTIIENAINGDLEGAAAGAIINIKADTLGELDMGDNINPRIRDNEILGIGVDTIANSTAVRITGLQPATDSDLTSDISAGEAYVNGFRVSKSATSNTYTANRDTWVDLNQTGTYTFTTVTNDAAEPVVAANSIRLAKVVTDGTTISTVVDESSTLVPGLVIPANYRSGLGVSRDVATPLTKVSVFPGLVEVNNTIISKTSTTTIDVNTAGDWASGTEDVTANGYVYVGISAAGEIKFDDTAASHQNFAVSVTVGRLKWATFTGSTVFRVLGWLYRNSDGQTEVHAFGNLLENDTPNTINKTSSDNITINDTSFGTDFDASQVQYYSSGGMVEINSMVNQIKGTGDAEPVYVLNLNGSSVDSATFGSGPLADASSEYSATLAYATYLGQGTHTIKLQAKINAGTDYDVDNFTLVVSEN